MIRAIALAARLDFSIEPTLLESIRTHRHEIAKSSAPRMLEEYYKILRAGSAEKAFRSLSAVGLLEPTSPELHTGVGDPLWKSLARLDAYRRRFESTPDTLTNAILLGTLLDPLGAMNGLAWSAPRGPKSRDDAPDAAPAGPRLGALPLARRDLERLRQIAILQRRLRDLSANPRVQRGLAHRPLFMDALTWLEIHGSAPELVEHWKALAP